MSSRKPILAGTWYPGNAKELSFLVRKYITQAKIQPIDKPVRGLISPHAGYIYSAQTAAYGYKHIENIQYDIVIILSPLHHFPVGNFVTVDTDFYETPLGQVPIEKQMIDELKTLIDITVIKHDEEHSLEIQLPFLQETLDNFTILPIMLGHNDQEKCQELANALKQIIKDKTFLIIASSDMYHTHDYETTNKLDNHAISCLESLDLRAIKNEFQANDCTICGKMPILTLIYTLKQYNDFKIKILHHTTSGDITNEKEPGNYTVGYLSAVFY